MVYELEEWFLLPFCYTLFACLLGMRNEGGETGQAGGKI